MELKRSIYLDNAATTPVAAEVAELVCRCMRHEYGNPASAHDLGIRAETLTREATGALSRAIGDADGKHGTLVWTSGGTESDALGVLGAARARKKRGKVLVISAIEHSAVRESAKLLGERGWEIRKVPVGRNGIVDPRAFADACDGAQVAALMLVNNEIGAIQPVAEVVRLAKQRNEDLHVHCDAVQALGKVPIDVAELGADSVAFAGHKLHGPKGIGATWISKATRVEPLWGGGGHQGGLRSGTLNVPGIAGMGLAVSLAKDTADWQDQLGKHSETLLEAARRTRTDFSINGEGAPRAPHILSIAFKNVPAEPLLHVLESRGVMVSAGSACAERDRRPSPVLQAIGLGANYGTIRFSFGRQTTTDEVVSAGDILVDAVRSFT